MNCQNIMIDQKKLTHADLQSITRVCYRDYCGDGFGGAFVFWKHLGNNAEYIPIKHGMTESEIRTEILPKLEDQVVVFVNIAFSNVTIMTDILMVSEKLLILDHHKSTKEILTTDHFLSQVSVFDMNKSGAVLAWEWCNPEQEVPRLLQHVQDRDIWTWKMENSKAFLAAFYKFVPYDFEEWNKYFEGDEAEQTYQETLAEGRTVQKYDEHLVESIAGFAVQRQFLDYNVSVVQSNVLMSEIGAYLVNETECDFSMIWFYDHKNSRIKVSLRSCDEKIDVSQVSRIFNGGGHRNASGFYTKMDIEELLNHTIPQDESEENKETKGVSFKTKLFLAASFGAAAVFGGYGLFRKLKLNKYY